MKKAYSYCLLKYYHSQVLGEVLNLGIVAFFPTLSQLIVVFPNTLKRLRVAYPSFPEKTIKAYLEYFETKANQINKTTELFYQYKTSKSLKALMDSEFLTEDSSMLQFTSYKTAILYSENVDVVLKNLSSTYFSLDDLNILFSSRKQVLKKEDWIKPDIKNKVAKIGRNDVFLPNQNELSFLKDLL